MVIANGMLRQWNSWWLANQADGTNWRHEVAVYYDPKDGSVGELERGEHRDYSKAPPGAICLTIDLTSEGRFDYIDLKTGWAPEAPDASDQMRLAGYVFSRLRNKDSVSCGILALRERNHSLMPAQFSGLTLELVEAEAKRVHLAVANGAGPTPGEHCRFCPVKEQCPQSAWMASKAAA